MDDARCVIILRMVDARCAITSRMDNTRCVTKTGKNVLSVHILCGGQWLCDGQSNALLSFDEHCTIADERCIVAWCVWVLTHDNIVLWAWLLTLYRSVGVNSLHYHWRVWLLTHYIVIDCVWPLTRCIIERNINPRPLWLNLISVQVILGCTIRYVEPHF